jgi:hypothetical protein
MFLSGNYEISPMKVGTGGHMCERPEKNLAFGLLLGLALFGTQFPLGSGALAQTRLAANNVIRAANSPANSFTPCFADSACPVKKRLTVMLPSATDISVRYDLGQSHGYCEDHSIGVVRILLDGVESIRDEVPFVNYGVAPTSLVLDDFDFFFPSKIVMGFDNPVSKVDPKRIGPVLQSYKRADRTLGSLAGDSHTFELEVGDAGWNEIFEIYAPPPQRLIALDASSFRPLKITSLEYKFPAKQQPDVLARVSSNPKAAAFFFTELWARVYMPAELDQPAYPILVFLHGDHASCQSTDPDRPGTKNQYATEGKCDDDKASSGVNKGRKFMIVPSHEGYAYLAERLASWGYFVISVNATRGLGALDKTEITDGPEYIPGRARLVLKHLQKLSEWNRLGSQSEIDVEGRFPGPELKGALDFSEVGLLGHSVGGEAVRAAYDLYQFGGDLSNVWSTKIRDAITFRGIFEIAPEDGVAQGQSRLFNSFGVNWNVLLPMCDGDNINLPGVKPFDRMIAASDRSQKSTFGVWGANHNAYNTEWREREKKAQCVGEGNFPLFPEKIDSPPKRTGGFGL